MTLLQRIEGTVNGTGQKGDCPTLKLILEPDGENMGVDAFTWTIGEKVTVVRNEPNP